MAHTSSRYEEVHRARAAGAAVIRDARGVRSCYDSAAPSRNLPVTGMIFSRFLRGPARWLIEYGCCKGVQGPSSGVEVSSVCTPVR